MVSLIYPLADIGVGTLVPAPRFQEILKSLMNLLFMGFSFFYLLKIAKISQDCRFYQGFLFECLYKLSRFGVKRVSGTSVAERNPAEPKSRKRSERGKNAKSGNFKSGNRKKSDKQESFTGRLHKNYKSRNYSENFKRGSESHGKRSRRGS